MNFTRRGVLYAVGGLCGLGVLRALGRNRAGEAAQTSFEFAYTDEEWRRRLTPAEYQVLRREATEPPFSHSLNDEHRAGVFHCAGCGLDLFSSTTKFDSGTGWPSFWQPLAGAVGARLDTSLGLRRTEVHCRRCGGHLGHVFEDGPRPTGRRYCINGLALTFAPADA